jgi:hypothetical protein
MEQPKLVMSTSSGKNSLACVQKTGETGSWLLRFFLLGWRVCSGRDRLKSGHSECSIDHALSSWNQPEKAISDIFAPMFVQTSNCKKNMGLSQGRRET